MFLFLDPQLIQSSSPRVTEMLTAANLLHFTPIVEKCCEYLRRKITPQNCIRMREFVTLQGLTKLQAILDK